ncbi:MAG TPA: F0F1 ATP synthase subunit gamma [Coleofasciculaceae cyanobacterium]
MPTLEALQRQITTAKDLQSVVKTMKVLAAVSIRQYERAVESLAEYTRTIELGLQAVLNEMDIAQLAAPSPSSHRIGAIVFGSDQGMCGQFNEQIATEALARLGVAHIAPAHIAPARIAQMQPLLSAPADLTWAAVGARVMAPLEAAGQTIDICLPMPSAIAGITPRVQELLLQIETWRFQQQVDQIFLFYNRPRSNIAYIPEVKQLLPLDQVWLRQMQQQPWDSRTLPIWTMESRQLFACFIRQYLFVTLYRAFAESLASENASRLMSMQVAEQNIETRLAEFNTQFQQQRQTSITDEILEIVAGAEVLTRRQP